ncbi:biotin-dependent carboxyltransferase family protein [Marinobacter sp.]|uniref:5-oxoprolinase subunit C family protein n=1 Tax=Marinobacter sp. TaxID=50741 RepID=UPI003561D445
MSGLRLVQPGPRTTVQDGGRTGFQHQGLSPGGAADLRAWRWANHLLDNAPDAACLEITLGNLVAVAETSLLLALTGASCHPRLNDTPVPDWGVFRMEPGDRLQLGMPGNGLLSYLAVAGGWQTRAFLGSRSAVAREGLAGLGVLHRHDLIPAPRAPDRRSCENYLRRQVPRPYQGQTSISDVPLKLIPGPDQSLFTPVDLMRLVHSAYQVTDQSDRMGYRFEGPSLASPGGVTSRGVTCGTLQIPGDGRPTVLLNDRQTIGGYPVPGTVPKLDCSRLSQCRPGDRVRFRWSDVAECQAERMVFEEQMRTLTWSSEGQLIRTRGRR